MTKKNTDLPLASHNRRLGAFLLDQIILSIFTLITGLIIFSTQQPVLNTLLSSFVGFANNLEGLSDSQIRSNYDAMIAGDTVQAALQTLVVPLVIWMITSVAISALYYILLTSQKGQTLGKKILRIHVTDASGEKPTVLAASERYFLFVGLSNISTVLLAVELLVYRTIVIPNQTVSFLHDSLDLIVFTLFIIGGIMILYRSDRRGYHDMSAGTVVLKKL